jgi:hypothetical protein
MPITHMDPLHEVIDPFATTESLGPDVEDPARITGGRYRLPDLTIHYRPDGTRWLETHGLKARKGGRQRVTNMVKNIGDALALDLWHQRMLIYGMVKAPDLYDLACATVATLQGEDQVGELKTALEKLAPRILAAAGAEEGANLGTAFHGFTEAQDLGLMHYARRVWHGKLANYATGLDAQGLIVEARYIERVVVIERYNLAGTLDRILYDRIADIHRIGDLKSQKKFWTWLEIAAQMASYAMADAIWDRQKLCFVDMPPVCQEEAVVAWMPVIGDSDETARGQTATGDRDGVDFFRVDLEKGRKALALCAEVGALRSEAKSVHQTWGLLRPAPQLAAVEAFARRLESVASLAEGSAVWAEVQKAGLSMDPVLLPLARELAQRFVKTEV